MIIVFGWLQIDKHKGIVEKKVEYPLVVIACKIFQGIYTKLTTENKYDSEKLLRGIRRPIAQQVVVGNGSVFRNSNNYKRLIKLLI